MTSPPAMEATALVEAVQEGARGEAPVPVKESASGPPPRLKRIGVRVASGLDWIFGFIAISLGLAILSVIPILNFLSLGYLLEVSGRIAASGRLRDGFVGVRKASAIGGLVIGVWLVMLPVMFVAGLWSDAELIAPGSSTAKGWKGFLVVFSLVTFTHLIWACLRGGRLRHFLWPAPLRFWRSLRRPKLSALLGIGERVGDWVASLRLPHYLWLGFRGFVGAVIWLAIPVGILIAAAEIPIAGLAAFVNLIGVALLTITVLYLPFLQAHFARTGRFEAMFQVRRVRDYFKRAPIAFWFALLVTLLFAMPLYLLKIELTPKEVAWMPALLFVAFIFPARMLAGWAMSRGVTRDLPRHWTFRWLARLAAVPVVVAYSLFVWMTQYLSWHGSLSLLEQHAFLVPAPLMGL